MKNSIFLLLVLFCSTAHTQILTRKNTYEYFVGYIAGSKDSTSAIICAERWLTKARYEENYSQQIKAIKTLMFLRDPRNLKNYSDTLLSTAEMSERDSLIGQAWLTRGLIYYSQNQHIKAFDCYMKAERYLLNYKNIPDSYKLKCAIANTKYYLGFYNEAISLYTECLKYFETENDAAYLTCLYNLGACHFQLGNYEECSKMNALGLDKGVRLDNDSLKKYFLFSEAVNQFGTKKYSASIKQLSMLLTDENFKDDTPNLAVANFYLGKDYLALGQNDIAIDYLKKVDTYFSKLHYLRPDLREAYELLIDNFKRKNDQEKQLYYTNRLLKLDSLQNPGYRYLTGKLRKEYDTRELLNSKADLEQIAKHRNYIDAAMIVAFVILIVFITTQYLKLRSYQRQYNGLMLKSALLDHKKPESLKNEKTNINLKPEVIETALENLSRFEQEKLFRSKDMDLQRLSETLNTNAKYARIILLQHRQKGPVEYIRDLKIDYIVEQLKENKKYRNYTDKALADEAGFGSTQNFTKAFRARLKMPPRHYIAQLNNH